MDIYILNNKLILNILNIYIYLYIFIYLELNIYYI